MRSLFFSWLAFSITMTGSLVVSTLGAQQRNPVVDAELFKTHVYWYRCRELQHDLRLVSVSETRPRKIQGCTPGIMMAD